jgi:ribosomal protein S18 acetylase RimI-like enzyme
LFASRICATFGNMPDVHEPQVSALLPERDSEVGAVLGRAFVNDPPLKVVLSDVNDPFERARILSRVFTLELTFQRRHGQPIYGIIREGKVVAAVVTEIASSISTAKMRLTDYGMLPRLVAAIGWGGTLRAMRLAKEMSQNRPTEPHLYLRLIGVDPGHRGCHYGMALLRHLHALASLRTDLFGIYLETATERNVAYFENAGYQVLGEMKPLGVRMWRMMHPLGQAASEGVCPKLVA